jgi:hypothetical protein
MSLREQIKLSQSLWKENEELSVEKKQIRKALAIWINMVPTYPFPLLLEKKYIAEYFDISVAYVNNFCNNYRKRYAKMNQKSISYQTFYQTFCQL